MGGDDTMGGGMDTMVPMEPEPTGVPYGCGSLWAWALWRLWSWFSLF